MATQEQAPESAGDQGKVEFLFNPFDPAFRIDPVPTYKRIVERGRVYRMPLGGIIITRHEDATMILHHTGTSHDPTQSGPARAFMSAASQNEQDWQRRRSFLFMDPPDHTRLRGLVSKAFTSKTVESLRPRIDELVNELIDAVEDKGRMDVIADLAYPLPVTIISEMLGVPPRDNEVFQEWSRELARGLDPEPAIPPEVLKRRMKAAEDFRDYFSDLIESRRKNPKQDLISGLIAAEEEGDKLTKDELLSTLILLLIAGHETTVNLIGNGVFNLMRFRSEWERLCSDPSLSKLAVEEVLRFDPPVLFTGRIAMEKLEVGGEVLDEGDSALVLIGAANRDPLVFPNPDEFDVGRAKNPHLAFGMGIHYCLGAPLAKVEGQIALAVLARRLPTMELESEDPPYRENIVLRGLAELPVKFRAK